MQGSWWIAIVLVLGSVFNPARAETTGSAPENNLKYAYYYQFADKSLVMQSFKTPIESVNLSFSGIAQAAKSFSLIAWNLVSQQLPVAPEPYDRKKHFGDWIVDPRNGNCLNTRGVVLVRDSAEPIALDPLKPCFVKKGAWYDPYSSAIFKDAAEVQIDHVVPLKHVYISGGFQWDRRVRCLYNNYAGFRTHLMVVMGTENLKKGDATPFSYLPPNKSYVCDYILNWLKIKKIWNLALIPPETQAIANAFNSNKCNIKRFEMSIQELYHQRKYINDNYRLCDNILGNSNPLGSR